MRDGGGLAGVFELPVIAEAVIEPVLVVVWVPVVFPAVVCRFGGWCGFGGEG